MRKYTVYGIYPNVNSTTTIVPPVVQLKFIYNNDKELDTNFVLFPTKFSEQAVFDLSTSFPLRKLFKLFPLNSAVYCEAQA
jgi:hypothetical protein